MMPTFFSPNQFKNMFMTTDMSFAIFENSQVVLNNATVETDNPDLRDRAYIYWRLLSTDPEVFFL